MPRAAWRATLPGALPDDGRLGRRPRLSSLKPSLSSHFDPD
jgi:hypothetical protein